MEGYTFVRLDKSNIRDLHCLFSIKSKNSGTLEKYKKKYDTKYTGVEYIGYFAYDRNKDPVAFYGIIPCFAKAGDEKILIAQAVDAITLPEHRRKGLFEKIVSLTTELARAEGIHFIYGVPNDLSYQGFIHKFNWSQNGNMIKFQFKTHQIPVSHFFKKVNKLHFLYAFYIKVILLFFRKGGVFSNSDMARRGICIFRDLSYFKYKNYSQKYLVKIDKTTIWFTIDGSMKIGDIQFSEEVDIEAVLRKLKWLAFLLGVGKVVLQFSPNSYWAGKLGRLYHAVESLPIIYLNISDIYDPKENCLSYADIDTF